ncbi:MAG TPA: hypothetical protein VD999_00330 [Vitreimonas sp.]|nr:hypothetical protein [Vitreimonas sp.]
MPNLPIQHKLNFTLNKKLYTEFSLAADKAGITKVELLTEWINHTHTLDLEPTASTLIDLTSYSFHLDNTVYSKLIDLAQKFHLNKSHLLRLIIHNNISGFSRHQSVRVFDNFIRHVEGKKAVSVIYDQLLESPFLKSYTYLDKTYRYFPENFAKFAQAVRNGTKVFNIYPDTQVCHQVEKKFHALQLENYHRKFANISLTNNCINVLHNHSTVAFISVAPVISATIIDNPLLYQNSLSIHDSLWNQLPAKL